MRIELHDELFDVGEATAENNDGYMIDREPNREMPYDNRFQNAVTFEMSLSRRYFYRRIYNLLDMMSEMGGLFEMLNIFCLGIVQILQYHGVYQFLMNDLFVQKNDEVEKQRRMTYNRSISAMFNSRGGIGDQ